MEINIDDVLRKKTQEKRIKAEKDLIDGINIFIMLNFYEKEEDIGRKVTRIFLDQVKRQSSEFLKGVLEELK